LAWNLLGFGENPAAELGATRRKHLRTGCGKRGVQITTTRRPAMKVRSDGMTRLARFLTLTAVAVLGGALCFNSAGAQQDQSGRSDRSSGRDNSGQNQSDQSRDSSGQSDQRRRSDSSQYSDRTNQDRSQRQSTTDRSASSDQYRGQQSSSSRGQSSRDQSGRGSQQEDVAWLGVFLTESDRNQGNQAGAIVTQVYPAGPAARAGLRPGDLVTAVDGQRVGSSSDLISAIEERQPGARAQLAVTRNNQQVNVPITLGSRESFTWRGQSEDQWGGGQSGGGQYGGQGGGPYAQGAQWSNQSGGQSSQQDHFSNVPPFAMQLEHERRLYEQNQRIETQIAQLQNEIRQLREALQQQQRR